MRSAIKPCSCGCSVPDGLSASLRVGVYELERLHMWRLLPSRVSRRLMSRQAKFSRPLMNELPPEEFLL